MERFGEKGLIKGVHKKHIAVVLLLFLSSVGFSQSVNVGSSSKIFLNPAITAYDDPTGALDIRQVTNASVLSKFRKANDVKPDITNSTYWISFTLASESPRQAVLVIDQSLVEFAELYSMDTTQGWRAKSSGSSIPDSVKEIIAETPAFYLNLTAQPQTFYVKVICNVLPPIYLMDVKYFNESYGARKRTITGIILGAILLNALLSLIQYVYTTRKIYLLYFAAMVGIVTYVVIAYGHIVYISSFVYSRLQHFTMIASFLSQFLVLIFGIELLEIRKKTNVVFSFALYFRYLLFLLFIVSVVFMLIGEPADKVLNVGIFTALVLTLLCVLIGGISIVRGRVFKSVSVVYMASYLFFASFTVLEVLHLSFGLPKYLAVNYIMIGFLIETVGIGVALNIKTKIELSLAESNLKHEQQEKFRILSEVNATLEKQVEQRTLVLKETVSELNETNHQLTEALTRSDQLKEELIRKTTELEATNNWKTKLIGIISHDLMSPLSSLAGLFSLMSYNHLSQSDFNEAKGQIEDNLRNLVSNLSGILKWVESEMVGSKINPTSFQLKPVVQSTLELLKQTAGNKGINLVNGVDDQLRIFADVNHVEVILRNLVNNAIKFSYPKTSIQILSRQDDNQAIVQVIDKGIGLGDVDPFAEHVRSRAGTNKEKGIGFGLIVCRELVEKNGGKIWARSNEGIGASFYFALTIGES